MGQVWPTWAKIAPKLLQQSPNMAQNRTNMSQDGQGGPTEQFKEPLRALGGPLGRILAPLGPIWSQEGSQNKSPDGSKWPTRGTGSACRSSLRSSCFQDGSRWLQVVQDSLLGAFLGLQTLRRPDLRGRLGLFHVKGLAGFILRFTTAVICLGGWVVLGSNNTSRPLCLAKEGSRKNSSN